jgi:hypothetical protein
VKIICSAAITAGVEVASNTSGLATTAVSTNRVKGTALSTTTAANQLVEVLLGMDYIKA